MVKGQKCCAHVEILVCLKGDVFIIVFFYAPYYTDHATLTVYNAPKHK